MKSAQIKRLSFSEKYGKEKASYSYLVKNVRNNENDPRKFIGTSTNDNVMKKMAWRWQESHTFLLYGNWLITLLLDT